MPTVINTNSAATAAAYNLRGIGAEHQRNLTRLTTGLRINSSSDDAAGMAVSMKMSAQIRRADAYSANIANSRSFLQTQDAALAQLGKLLERMSELKALAHDVTKNGGDVDLYEKEYIQLQEQFAKTTTEQFNGINLFSPTSTPDPLYVSHPERGDTIKVSRPSLGDLHVEDALTIGNTIKYVTTAAKVFEMVYGNFTWNAARLDAISRGGHLATITSESEFQEICNQVPEFDSGIARPWLGGTDEGAEGNWRWITGEPWNYTRWTSDSPNNAAGNQNYLWSGWQHKQLWDDTTEAGGDLSSGLPPVSDYLLEKEVTKTVEIKNYLSIVFLEWSDLHATIQQVANARAQNGAEQMQLQMAADLNATNTVNLEQALSRIQDVDIAQVTSDLARTKVLIEAGTAMLAQANQSSKSILSLVMQN
jgi:flagellin